MYRLEKLVTQLTDEIEEVRHKNHVYKMALEKILQVCHPKKGLPHEEGCSGCIAQGALNDNGPHDNPVNDKAIRELHRR